MSGTLEGSKQGNYRPGTGEALAKSVVKGSCAIFFGLALGTLFLYWGHIDGWSEENLAQEPSNADGPGALPEFAEAMPEAPIAQSVAVPRQEDKLARAYREQLKSRLSLIEALIEDAAKLDLGPQGGARPEGPSRGSYSAPQLGIGGGKVSHAPIISSYPQQTGAFSRKQNAAVDILDRYEALVDRFRMLPIGAPVQGLVSSAFGRRYSSSSGRYHSHSGIDLAVESKTPVVATADGVVVMAGYKGDYGRTVILRHENGVETLYGHLAKIDVGLGERVCRGEQIGLVGMSGRSTGPHLHYEVRIGGAAKDPWPYIELAHLVRLARLDDAG